MSLLHPTRRGAKPLVRPQFVFGKRVTDAEQLVWATPVGADHEHEPVVAHAPDLAHGVRTVCKESLARLSVFQVGELQPRRPRWCERGCWLGPRCDCGTPLTVDGVCVVCLTAGLATDKQIERGLS